MSRKINISKEKLEELYNIQKLSSIKIAKIFKCSRSYILKQLKEYGIKRRSLSDANIKYSKNDAYFSTPNPENCYWAGFIAADGCITIPSSRTVNPILSIKLQQRDENHLVNFKDTIEYTGYVYNYDGKLGTKSFPRCDLTINSSKKYSEDLNKNWNITTKKSQTLQGPNISDIDLCLSYIIGYIDGDGCIGIYKNIVLSIISNEDFLNWVYSLLSLFESDKYKKNIRKCETNCYCLYYSSNRAFNILSLLYNIVLKYNLPVLERKWNKFIQWNSESFEKAEKTSTDTI